MLHFIRIIYSVSKKNMEPEVGIQPVSTTTPAKGILFIIFHEIDYLQILFSMDSIQL